MSNKFTGITSAGSAIPVYDKDAHQALSSKLDASALDSLYISGKPNSFSAGLNPSGENPSFVVNFEGSEGLSASCDYYKFGANPGGVILSGNAAKFSADYHRLYLSGMGGTVFSAGNYGLYYSANDNLNGGYNILGFGNKTSASIDGELGIAISSKAYNGDNGNMNGMQVTWGPSLPKIRVSGQQSAVLDISESGASFTDNYGNVKWKVEDSNIYCWNGYGDKNNAMPILLGAAPLSAASAREAGSFLSAGCNGIEVSYGPSSAPRILIDQMAVKSVYPGITASIGFTQGFELTGNGCSAKLTFNGLNVTGDNTDVRCYVPSASATYTLRNSVQLGDIGVDSATSAITAIAGSAIGGGGGVPQSAFDAATAKIEELESILSAYSGQWLLA